MSKTRNNRVINAVVIIAAGLVILIVVCALMWFKLTEITDNQVETHVSSYSYMASEIVNNTFEDELSVLRDMTSFVDIETGRFNNVLKPEEGISYGVMKIDGEPSDGEQLDFSEYSGFFDALHGNPSVCCGKTTDSILFAVPVYNGKNIKYVLYKLYDNRVLEDKINLVCYDQTGECFLIDTDGRIILRSDNSSADMSFFTSEKNSAAIEELKNKMNLNVSAAAYSGTDTILFSAETNYNGLYIIGCVPSLLPAGDTELLVPLVLWTFGLLWLLLVIITIYLMVTEKKVQESDEFKQAKIAAEKANRAKSDFLANMSHEIRTPINAVIGMNEMILRESEEEAILEYASVIDSASHNLLALINDVLDFSKIESGKMDIVEHEYSLKELLSSVMAMIKLRADEKNLRLEVSVGENLPNRLYGDDVRIKQILINLLGNAIKYTQEGSIKLTVSGETDSLNNNVCLDMSVSDTGIGIHPEDLSTLFTSFSRFDLERNRSIEGTGLGLAISNRLALLMNGLISVESEYGKGSVFTLHISQNIMGPELIGKFNVTGTSVASIKKYIASFTAPTAEILAVDDNQMNLMVVKNLLKNTKVKLTVCASGEEALKLVKNNRYDLILLDHMMPKMDGIETLQNMRGMPDNMSMNAVMIALTANAVSGARDMYIEAGFDGYLSKPINGRLLEETLANYLPTEKITYKESIITESETKSELTDKSEPLFDRELGIRYCADSEDIFMEILTVYSDMYDEKLCELNRLISEKDWNNYTISIHSLKSNSLNVGCKRLSDLCLKLELAGKSIKADENAEENIKFITENHKEAMALYTETITAVRKYLQEK